MEGGICRENNSKIRKPRAFYKDAGVFKEYSLLNSMVYESLRSTIKEPVQPFASLTDSYFGAFKLCGDHSNSDDDIDSSILMLSSSYLVVLHPNLSVHELIKTNALLKPERDRPNPTIDPEMKRTLKVTLKDG